MKKIAKFFKAVFLPMIVAAALLFSSCVYGGGELSKEPKTTEESDRLVDFAAGSGTGNFYTANGYSNGGMFNCVWRSSCAVVSGGVLDMTVRKAGGGYEGAEYR